MSMDVLSALTPGGEANTRGVLPRGAHMVAAVSLRADTAASIVDQVPPKDDCDQGVEGRGLTDCEGRQAPDEL